ncbi:peptidoglycan-associated lipoprotein Pal [Sphingomonas xinjiangensis]|uniref:Peptidoglycan-associated lipoprotein n=1 Tax=Sphingomonas xinjiangensis TaxID=643568 RepID=A0A840YR60_9SPHN|nr:peptidoglycan-associated lipoprotein Pal [Sphingomonas xinjiangensis]MBB5711762.1 peptidoglycan-associated lipoprotein [Sphingomonas xinjiangensis]
MAKMTTSLLLAVALVGTAGCAKKRPPELPPAPVAEGDLGAGAGAGDTSDQYGSSALNEQFKREVMSDTVRFGLDQYDIDPEARRVLDSQAQWLAGHPATRITIEGHADERGTREYNLGLGDRRANAAKNYLAARGISATRITTISYGKERPVALGSDEAAWAQNRRAVTIVIS